MSYYTVKQMAMRYPAFTEASLWDYVFHRNKNGFDKCTSKIEDKRIIYDAEFQVWVKEKGKKNNTDNIQKALGLKKKSQWEIEFDKMVGFSPNTNPPAQIIHDDMVLDWHCESGHIFPYTYREINLKGITCPKCECSTH